MSSKSVCILRKSTVTKMMRNFAQFSYKIIQKVTEHGLTLSRPFLAVSFDARLLALIGVGIVLGHLRLIDLKYGPTLSCLVRVFHHH